MDAYERADEDSLTRDDIDVPPDPAKCSELMLLVTDLLRGDQYGGATKVNKVMYFAEFAHVRETGLPISGVPYQKLEHGPVLRDYRAVRRALVDAGDAVETRERFLGLTQNRLVPTRPVRREMFSATELKAVEDAVRLLWNHSAKDASGVSHDEPGWRMVDYGEDIPFVTALLPAHVPAPSERVRTRMREIAERLGREGRLAT